MGITVFLLAGVIAALLVLQIEHWSRTHERTVVAGYVKDYAHHLESNVTRTLSSTYALAALVEVSRGDIPNFDEIAAQLLPRYPGASELAIAPDGIISRVAPLQGNEKAIGLNLLSNPEQKTEATISRDSRELTLAGPFELVQGGQALAGRLPVFLKNAQGDSTFWGFTEVVMRLPDVLRTAQLPHLSTRGYRYVLWRVNPQTQQKQIIESSLSGELDDPVEETIQVPQGTWTLSVDPERGWTDWGSLIIRSCVALLIVILLSYLAAVVTELRARRRELEVIAAQRTADSTLAKDQLKATLDAIPDLVWLKDINGRFLSCNPQFERFFGAREADIIGRTDYDFVDRKLADFFRENDKKALEADKPCAYGEWLTFVSDGYRGFFETIKTPMRGRDGKVLGVLGIARDITARYRAEKTARLHKTRLNVALQSTQIAIWDWDIKRDRWFASAVYYTSLGYRPETGRGNREVWIERLHPDDRPRVRAVIQAALSGSPMLYEYEARMRHADGSYRWISVRGMTVERDQHGLATRMLGVRLDITEKKNTEERIQRLAHYDTLTGLPNRVLLNERMPEVITQAQVQSDSIAVLVIDIDKFKNINDTFGQAIGDELLVEVARRIQSQTREEHTAARIGGDTFVVVLAHAKQVQATRMAQRLMDWLSEPFRVRDLELFVTPSIGVALFPEHGADFDALLKCADAAMHRAKSRGRNNFVFFSEDMHIRSARNLVLETALRHAIERSELQLHYQPQVSLLDGRMTGAEALLRWNNPDLGMVSPAEFIPITEDSGQILTIGSWVLRTAADQLRAWLDLGIPPFTLAVNLSSVQFRHPNLPGFIRKILNETKLQPGHLELELTERVAMEDPTGAIAVMSELHELGVRISIDDFGTGYSSLNYLKRFQASKLKIDQSFVRGLANDSEDQAIVKAIINLASSLGVETIAEGVETAAQLEFLRTHGCKEAQGYYFSPPVPVDEFTALALDQARHPRDWPGIRLSTTDRPGGPG